MGILDRKYGESDYESGGYRPRFSFTLSATMWIIIANVGVFLLAARGTPLGRWVYDHGHFATYWMGWPNLEVWRLLTFQFLHADLTHIVFNMIGFYVFAPTVEQHLGKKKFVAFYLVCGICGGLMYLVLNALGFVAHKMGVGPVPILLFNDVKMPLVGASAGVFGVIMACAYIEPDVRVVVFPIPFEVKIKTLAYAYFALALIGLIFRGQNQGGEAAHVGGAIAGFFFVRNSHLLRDFFDILDDSRKPKSRHPGANTMGFAERLRGGGSGAMPEAELDRILAKIKISGFDSLSESEKRALREDTETRRRGTG